MTIKDSQPPKPDFQDFIRDTPASELVETLDKTLLHLVLLIGYEPLLADILVKLYESLYQLREFIKKYI